MFQPAEASNTFCGDTSFYYFQVCFMFYPFHCFWIIILYLLFLVALCLSLFNRMYFFLKEMLRPLHLTSLICVSTYCPSIFCAIIFYIFIYCSNFSSRSNRYDYWWRRLEKKSYDNIHITLIIAIIKSHFFLFPPELAGLVTQPGFIDRTQSDDTTDVIDLTQSDDPANVIDLTQSDRNEQVPPIRSITIPSTSRPVFEISSSDIIDISQDCFDNVTEPSVCHYPRKRKNRCKSIPQEEAIDDGNIIKFTYLLSLSLFLLMHSFYYFYYHSFAV